MLFNLMVHSLFVCLDLYPTHLDQRSTLGLVGDAQRRVHLKCMFFKTWIFFLYHTLHTVKAYGHKQ